MTLRSVIIMYEDSRSPRSGFGLHDLVIRCVLEELEGVEHYELAFGALHTERNCRPMNGNAELLHKGCHQTRRIGARGQPVVAVFDNDKIRRLLKLPHDTPEIEVVDYIVESSSAQGQLHIVLLKENIESVLEIIVQNDPTITAEQSDRAINKKELSERDILLQQAGREANRTVRQALLTNNDSFREMIALITQLVSVD